MGEVAAREENEKHVPPRPLVHRLDSVPALVPRSGLDPPKHRRYQESPSAYLLVHYSGLDFKLCHT